VFPSEYNGENNEAIKQQPAVHFVICNTMKNYLVRTPWLLKKIYPRYVWAMPEKEKKIYLTFDDGPHPVATGFVLDELKKFNARATFFCIGKNVTAEPNLYTRILDEGHSVGNHTENHLNGWKTKDDAYLADCAMAALHIDSSLFRPPYGRITSFQATNISKALKTSAQIIMWDVLSGDFDEKLSEEDCLKNVVLNTRKGSIVVFHDSQKALAKLIYTLPRVLQYFGERGFIFEKIENFGRKTTEEGNKLFVQT
jgi:peptidoglycan-N-acetylglucosamine deacetylase